MQDFSRMLSDCHLCPRHCRVNREKERGYCGAGNVTEVFSYAPHHGEEPPISGTCGSGTVFFSRCTLRCIYCQNFPWSQESQGSHYDAKGLRGILRSLHDQGCHNWNLVSPTPWIPQVVAAIEELKHCGISLPVVYNTSGFEDPDILSMLDGIVDVYLPDLRYANDKTANEVSRTTAYVETARAAMLEMWRQVGELTTDADGVATGGTICRLLVLPGHADEAVDNLRWLASAIGTDLSLSVMSQYTPVHEATGLETWGRGVTGEEYEQVCAEVEDLGFSRGWIQQFDGGHGKELLGCNMKPTK